MKRNVAIFILLLIIVPVLNACNFNILNNKKIDAETLNYISTNIMDSNIKISTSTYNVPINPLLPVTKGPLKGYGSGVVFKKEEIGNSIYYYALTNNHVVYLDDTYNHKHQVEDIYNNNTTAELIARSDDLDLAILRFTSKEDLTVIEFARENPKKYDMVFSVGSPSGKHNIITAGIVLGYQEIESVDFNVIFHNAYIYKGSSGSMLINEKYELVGINTWGFFPQENNDDFVEGGAIPIEKIIEFLENNK